MTDQKHVDLFVLFGPVRDVRELRGCTDELNQWFEFDVLIQPGDKGGQRLNLDAIIRTDDTEIGSRELIFLLTLFHLNAFYILQVLH